MWDLKTKLRSKLETVDRKRALFSLSYLWPHLDGWWSLVGWWWPSLFRITCTESNQGTHLVHLTVLGIPRIPLVILHVSIREPKLYQGMQLVLLMILVVSCRLLVIWIVMIILNSSGLQSYQGTPLVLLMVYVVTFILLVVQIRWCNSCIRASMLTHYSHKKNFKKNIFTHNKLSTQKNLENQHWYQNGLGSTFSTLPLLELMMMQICAIIHHVHHYKKDQAAGVNVSRHGLNFMSHYQLGCILN